MRRWSAAPLGSGGDGKSAIDNHGVPRCLNAGGVDPAINVQLRHARFDMRAGPGVPGLGGAHAAAERFDLVGVLATTHLGQGVEDHGGIAVADAVLKAQAGAIRIHPVQRR